MLIKADGADAHLPWVEHQLVSAGFCMTSATLSGSPEDVIMHYCSQRSIHLLAMGASSITTNLLV